MGGVSAEFIQKGLKGQFWICFLEMRRVVFPNCLVALLFVTGGPSKEKWGESSFNFLPATSARAAKRKSTLPWEAPGGDWRAAAPSLWGWGAPGGQLARDAGRGKPLPCTPPLANGAWSGPAAALADLSPAANLRPLGLSSRPGSRPSSLPAAPSARKPSAAGPARPAKSPPARPSSGPERFPAPRRRPGSEGGAEPRGSPARWIPGPLRRVRGAGRRRARPADTARRLKLCCSRDGAVVTSSRSGWRGPGCGPAARARWRAGPCSRPRPRLCAPSAAGGRGQRSAEPAPLAVKLAPAGSFSRRRSEVAPPLRLGGGDGVGVQGPKAEVPGETKGEEVGRESFFSVALRLGRAREQSALCICFGLFFVFNQIMTKLDLKTQASSPHIPS